MSVLGGKAADAVTKAVSKCLKEKQPNEKSKSKNKKNDTAAKREESPLANLYPPTPQVSIWLHNLSSHLSFHLLILECRTFQLILVVIGTLAQVVLDWVIVVFVPKALVYLRESCTPDKGLRKNETC